MLNPDLYAVLPPDKKEEYKKLFPEPVIDYAMPTIRIDGRVPSGYAFLGDRIIKPMGVGVGAITFMPSEYIPGPLTCVSYIDYSNETSKPEIGLSHGEQRLIKKGVVNK